LQVFLLTFSFAYFSYLHSKKAQLSEHAPAPNFAKHPEHTNLYYKLAHGSLDLYTLSPFATSADYKDFVQQQQHHLAKHHTHHKSQLNPDQLFRSIPLAHITSAVVLLVWTPHVTKAAALAGENNNALRLLFTGNAPQHVVLNALDKVKDFEVLQSPVWKVRAAQVGESAPARKAAAVNGGAKPKTAEMVKAKVEAPAVPKLAAVKGVSSKPPAPKAAAVVAAAAAAPVVANGNSNQRYMVI
jgi:hypothetical protein